MHARHLLCALAAALVAASCSDRPDSLGPDGGPASQPPAPAASIVDGSRGGNAFFHWLPPLGAERRGFSGTADGGLNPAVEVCLRNAAGDGCAAGPALASFTRSSEDEKRRLRVDGKAEYFALWNLEQIKPSRGSVYRIRVLLQGEEVGHADVVPMLQRDIAKGAAGQGGDVVGISDRGTFRIAFRLEDGVLQEQFCDYDGDGDVQDCDAGVQVAGDGQSTTLTVSGTTSEGDVVAAVITAPDGVFTDSQGNPIPEVVITAEVEVTPPSFDVLTDDDQEIPFFIEVNTVPEDVFIQPPGVSVVVCQNLDVLAARGIDHALHPQLLLYKVSDGGVTKRLPFTYGAPECEGAHDHDHAASGVLGKVRAGASRLLELVGPRPLVARRLHGGLNTVITRDADADAAFSTFGAALGPLADSSFAVVDNAVLVGDAVDLTVQLRNALGESFLMAGDSVFVTVRGANPTSTFLATDAGSGLHWASYTANVPGVDSVDVVLVRADGWVLGPLGGSPYLVDVTAPPGPPSPSITSATPASPGGAGQGLTFFGTDMENTVWTFTPAPAPVAPATSAGPGPSRVAGPPPSYTAFTFLSPSTSTVQYVYTAGIPEGDYLVTVTDQVTGRTSDPFPYSLGSRFGTPVLVGVFGAASSATPLTTLGGGNTLFIQGYGIYTTLTDACFTQGTAPVSGPTCGGTLATGLLAYSGPDIGIRVEFVLPSLVSGPVWVQIRSGNSDFSAPVALTVP